MKKLLVAVAAFALSTSAFAQTGGAAGSTGGQFGLGVAIVPLDAAGQTGTIEVYAPIRVAPNLRVEPSVGIFTEDTNQGVDTTNLTVGAGVFVMQKVAAAADLYAGGRIKLNFVSADDGTNDDSGTDFFVAAAAGGEYYLAPKFSIGLEGQLGFYSLADLNGDTSGFFTTGLGFLRIYF